MNDNNEQNKKDILAILLWLGVTVLKLLPVLAVITLIFMAYTAVNSAAV